MMFYDGTMFPEKYRGGIFSAQHGSWNRTTPVGARVMFTSLDEEGAAAGRRASHHHTKYGGEAQHCGT